MMDFLYSLDYEDERGPLKVRQEKRVFESDSDEEALGYPHRGPPPGYDPISLLINAKVYIIAEKYDIRALKEIACTKYKEVWPTTWNSSCFTESACLVYENTVEEDRMLRDVIVKAASDNIKTLLDRREFVDLLKSCGDLATDILRNEVSTSGCPGQRELEEDRRREVPKFRGRGGFRGHR